MTDHPLTELLGRIESAEKADRELDADLFYAFHPDSEGTDRVSFVKTAMCRYTASVDAALALVEVMLPGWVWFIDATAPELGIDCNLEGETDGAKGTGNTPALAILAALLKALIAKDAYHGQ